MAKAPSGLTEKQEAFAVAYVTTANAAESYRQAYDVDPNARDEWIYVEAFQLLDHPKISPRIVELQEAAKRASAYTVIQAMEEYENARTLAHSEGQAGAAVSAVSAKVKLLGLEKPAQTIHKHTGQISHRHASEMTDDELAAIAAGSSAGIIEAATGEGEPD